MPDPGRYGVAELDGDTLVGIEEKPAQPKSDCAVAGIYVYPADVFDVIRGLKPSRRGELEITDVNNSYLKRGRLGYVSLDGYWTDAGTPESYAWPTSSSTRTFRASSWRGMTNGRTSRDLVEHADCAGRYDPPRSLLTRQRH